MNNNDLAFIFIIGGAAACGVAIHYIEKFIVSRKSKPTVIRRAARPEITARSSH
mgnify:CR=1 FL=1